MTVRYTAILIVLMLVGCAGIHSMNSDREGGGWTELFGNFSYTTTAGGLAPMFVNADSSVFALFNEVCYNRHPFRTLIRETRAGTTKEVAAGQGGIAPYSGYSGK